MNATNTLNKRAIPPMPGGGSWTFDEDQWAWIPNDPTPAQAPVTAAKVDAANEPAAASATHQE